MTNLTDLLPAGAGGKQVSFTASGAISQGDAVILNSSGTVSTPTNQSASISSPANVGTSQDMLGCACIYDSSEGCFIQVGGNTLSGNTTTVIAGTLSGSTVTWGTGVTVSSSASSELYKIAGDNSGGFVVFYRNNFNDRKYAVAGTVSGTTITLGSNTEIDTSTGQMFDICYDPDSDKYVAVFNDTNNSFYTTAVVLTTTGTSVSAGTAVVVDSTTIIYGMACSYSTADDKVLVVAANNGNLRATVGTVSGTSTSWGTTNQFYGDRPVSTSKNSTDLIYHSGENHFLFVYCSDLGSEKGRGIAGTISGTTSTWGSLATTDPADADKAFQISGAYDSVANKIVLAYEYGDVTKKGKYNTCTLSGNTQTYTAVADFDTSETDSVGVAFSSDALKSLIVYRDEGDSDVNKYVVQANAIQNYTDFIGIADAAISDTASGNITIKGGIASNGLSSLTPGSTYYVQSDGTLSTTSSSVTAGKALSATSINLDYSS
jgi:hypothetical protein